MNPQQTKQMNEESTLFPTYKKWELTFESAEGTYIKASNGKTYLDCMAGIGVVNLGHSHPAVLKSVEEQLHKGWHGSNFFQYEGQEKTAQLLTEQSSGDIVFFANSGTEANEAAIKLSRKYTGRTKIISFVQSFHGRTLGSMAATGQESIHQGFGPMLQGFEYLPYNDVNELESAIDEDTAAVMVEPIQGEGGVVPASSEFLQAVESLCKKNGALFVVDEVQTGIGRTGAFFAYEHAGVSPDIIVAAKGLGNGFPVGAIIGKKYLESAFGPGTHGTTFGGNPLAMAAAQATLETVLSEDIAGQAAEKGAFLMAELEKKIGRSDKVKDIRGKGLMVGIELHEPTAEYIMSIQKQRVLMIGAGPNVIRLLPPLTITKEELQHAVNTIASVLNN